MALRYWVGGSATWDATAGAKWALTSGGAGGQAVPTAADDVFLDAASGAVTVTVSGSQTAKSITCTGFTGTLEGTATPILTVAGSCTFVAGMTYSATGPALVISATGTLTSGGKTIPGGPSLTVTGGTCTLGDALTLAAACSITGGTFTTSASNYSVSCASFSTSGTTARTITLNASTITCTGVNPINFAGSAYTFNAGTSQINCTSAAALTFTGGSQTFYNVAFTSTNSAATVTLVGTQTYNNLSITAPTSGIKIFFPAAAQTVSGTFTCPGTSGIGRVFIASAALGTVRNITIATFSASDVDFRDMTVSGAASPISGTRLGNCGGNTGITFPAAKTVYWNPAAAADFASASWATSSGGTTLSTDNFPLAQDTAIIDNASRAGINANTIGVWNVGTIDTSSRTTAFTWTLSGNGLRIYKDWLYGTGVTNSGAQTLVFSGRGTQTITSNGRTFAQPININGIGNTVQLADDFASSTTLTLITGTFDAVTYNVQATGIIFNATTARTLSLGSGTWTLTGTGTIWNPGTAAALTFNKNTAGIVLQNVTAGARTFGSGGLTYNKLTIGGATGTSTLTFTGSGTFTEIASTKTVAHTILFTAGTTTTVDAWTVTGTAGNVVTVGSVTAATHTLSKTGGGVVSADYLALSNSIATPVTTWYAGANSTDSGGNTGWIFTAPPSTGGDFIAVLKLRSFTERRRF